MILPFPDDVTYTFGAPYEWSSTVTYHHDPETGIAIIILGALAAAFAAAAYLIWRRK